MISVLTPTLGSRPSMLVEAVESVRAQTFPDWEHIVVDDGSFQVPDIDRVNVVRVSRRGVGLARNAGLEHARGEAIALLDDDDIWLPQHLETVWAEMERTGADVVYADCEEVGRRDGHHIDVRSFDSALLASENFICLPATLVRACSLRMVGGFPSGSLEDWRLWKAMHKAGMRFSFVPKKTVLYRFHADNLTYGGVDPSRTAAAQELLERAMDGGIGWKEYEEQTAEVWR
jgi:glycosyltransferase involved in cell wall biosynthesis